MELDGLLIIIFLALAIIKTVLAYIAKKSKRLSVIEEDLTFILETLGQLVTEIEKVKEWIRSLELEKETAQNKKESGGKVLYR